MRNLTKAALVATLLAVPTTAFAECGKASWYSLPGQTTASGDPMNPNAMTAAHKTLPFGTVVNVVNQKTGKSVRVTINDRGPYVSGRIIDLSKAAAHKLGIIPTGTGRVCIS